MKKTMTLVLGLITAAAMAQYNNTYDVNVNNDNLTPAFVITDPNNGETTTVSYASDGPGRPRTDYFILTKLDASGQRIYNFRYTPVNAPTDGFTNVEALIETKDGGTMIAGYYYDDRSFIEQPFLMKVDYWGNFQWFHIYYINRSTIVRAETNKISLCRVADDEKENYFIVDAADSDINSGRDVATNVIKVDNAGGQIFNHKYYASNPDEFRVVRDYPGDIEFSKRDGVYLITGYRQETIQTGQHQMYFLAIDRDGNVVRPFLTLHSKSVPMDQDMVLEPERNEFGVVFTHFRSTYVQGINSLIGFITASTANPLSITVSNPKYLWHREGDDHNGRSISLCGKGPYLLGSGVKDIDSQINNPAWLKVDATGAVASDLVRYNVRDNVIFGHHCTSAINGQEDYVFASEHKTDLRQMRPDFNGKLCGDERYKSYDKEYDLKKVEHKYRYEKGWDYKRYEPRQEKLEMPYRKCDNDASDYRTTGIATANLAEIGVSLYPSVISSGNAAFTIENNSGAEVSVNVRSITGQLIYSGSQLGAGKTDVKLNSNLASGVYLVQIFDGNGALTGTSKIVISE